MRKQVRFHHRRPLASGDVKFSLERLMRRTAPIDGWRRISMRWTA
ncbi:MULTISPECIES: hypothetical protein [Paenibacillus]